MSDELKYRLNQFEADPPANAWENISSSIDEWNELSHLSNRLQNAMIDPPANVWHQIENRLEDSVTAIEGSPTRKIGYTIYRVAASVVIVTLLISGAWKLFAPSTFNLNDDNGKNLPTASIEKSTLLPSFPNDIQKSTKREKINSLANNAIAIKYEEQNNNDPGFKRSVRYASIEGSKWLTKESPIIIDIKPIDLLTLETVRKVAVGNARSNKYLVISAPDGQSTLISIKFADLMNYLNTEVGSSEDDLNTDNLKWKKIFKEWREKIMHSGYTPTSGNFLDIAEFTEFIKKNQ